MTNDTSKNTAADQADQLDQTWTSDPDEFFSPRKRARSKRGLWQGIAIGLGAGVAITTVAGVVLPKFTTTGNKSAAKTQQQAPPSQTVTVAITQSSPIPRTLQATGSVAARDLIPVLPQTTGLQIKQILVGEGQEVKATQVMAVLDDSVLRSQIDGAKADIESKQATVQQKQAALQQSIATQADAQRTLGRFQTLANNGAISRQELDTRSTTAATATAGVRVAEANIGTAQADVRSSVARFQQLQTQLGQTVIRAPTSGVVAEKIANIGDVSNGTQKLFTLIGNGQLELQAQVPATQLPQVRINSPVKVTSDTDSRVRLSGRVREIAPLVNAQNRQALVRIDLPATTFLRPGMFARAAITTTTTAGVTVPNKAVLPQPNGSMIVFLLAGEDKVQARKVEVGEVIQGGTVEIKSGLKSGDRIVVAGAGYLKDGDRIRIAN